MRLCGNRTFGRITEQFIFNHISSTNLVLGIWIPLAKTCATWLQRTVTLSTGAANSVQAAAEWKQYTGDFQLGGVYMAETPSSINVLKTGNNYRISNVINPRKPLSQSSSQGRLENLHQSITSLNQHMEAQS